MKCELLVAVIIATTSLTMACKSQRDDKKPVVANNEKRDIKKLTLYDNSQNEEEHTASDVAPDS